MPVYQPNDIVLNKYRIEKFIDRGAFGEVYLARHLKLDTLRALKVMRKDAGGVDSQVFAQYQQRFELEAKLGARVNHPNVIQVYDFDQEGTQLVLAMEYAPGGSLEDRIEKAWDHNRPMDVPQVLRLANDLAQGLAALHALDIVHRDLKPSNILFAANGDAKLIWAWPRLPAED
jgi:serine/threonine protein kinase